MGLLIKPKYSVPIFRCVTQAKVPTFAGNEHVISSFLRFYRNIELQFPDTDFPTRLLVKRSRLSTVEHCSPDGSRTWAVLQLARFGSRGFCGFLGVTGVC